MQPLLRPQFVEPLVKIQATLVQQSVFMNPAVMFDLQPDGTPHPLYTPPRVVFGQQIDAEPGLARLYAELTREALRGDHPENLVEVTADATVPVQ
jgi:hypothetical protein